MKKKNEPSKLVNRNIVEEGLNLVIFKSYIGKTIAVTNPLELKRRDLNRPEVDYKKVISIRLAKILVNLTKVKPNETLLDPFCGSGTILQEALLKSINVVGLDNDVTTIDQAKANLEWLSKTYHVKDNYKLINVDCRELANQLKGKIINGVASEPYMGPFIRKLPTISQARGLVEELTELYTTLLRGLKQVVKKGGRVVIVIPRFKTRENTVVFLDFRDMAENSGFSIALKPIAYGYAENKLLREIYVLENN